MYRFLAVWTLSATLAAAPLGAAAAQACHKQSPAHTVALLELYTSEGCSSCPPADRFVSDLSSTGLMAAQVVPLSLHVGYWDYIGWKDRFAKQVFSERQRQLSALAFSHTLYTPEFFVAGREVRGWQDNLAAKVRDINRRPAQAQIDITLGQQTDGGLAVEVGARASRDAGLFVALYENGLSSDVKAGENDGVVLHHDYVVRDWIGPLPLDGQGQVVLRRTLAIPAGAQSKDLGVAAFVQTQGGEVLQALALPLCSG